MRFKQTLVMNEPMLLIGSRFEFAGSFRRVGIWDHNCVDRLSKKGDCCLAHLDQVLPNRLQFVKM